MNARRCSRGRKLKCLNYCDSACVYVSPCLCAQLVLGGDLLEYMESHQPLPAEATKFYAASAICAVEYLHNKHIAYRDLKPENLMIDAKG